MKIIEKTSAAVALLLLFAAAGLTVSAESRRFESPIEINIIRPTPPQARDSVGELVNINTAGPDELCTLSGIGPVLAQRIIDYRIEYGPFLDAADIIDVSGIGLATFEKIKDYITV